VQFIQVVGTKRIFSLRLKNISWQILKVVAPILVILFFILGIVWQNEVRELVGAEQITGPYGILFAASTIINRIFIY
jgi:uncharacterized membrane protein